MTPTRFLRRLAVVAGGLLVASTAISSAHAQTGGTPSQLLDVDVTAEVVGSAPFSVSATDVAEDDDGLLRHGVVVTWNDPQDAILGDERFTHHVSAEDGEGDLVISGRGCGASWAEVEQDVLFPCTLDLQAFPVARGESHEYPVWIHPEVGPLTLQPGTYVVEQVVSWYRPNAEDQQQQATIRVTYEVSEAPPTFDISVAATIVEAGAPVSVISTPVTLADGRYSHGVRVTWRGTGTVMLDDARFGHQVTAVDGSGDLVTAGRGCAPNWSEGEDEVFIVCTADLQLIELDPGETHQYPVTITPSIGPKQLEPGTYVVDEPISWQPQTGTGGQFTVRLTYTVTEADETPDGVLSPEPSVSGISLASWSGGPASSLPAAKSYWTTVDGSLVPYIPGAPAFLNARFLAVFPQLIPAGTLFIVIR